MAATRPSTSASSPLLSVPDILNHLKQGNYKIDLCADDIKNPTPETLLHTMNMFVNLHMAPIHTEFKKAPFKAMEQLSYPELYEQGVYDLQICRDILELCWRIGCPHISLKHLLYPDAQHTREMLSAAINFALFEGEYVKVYQEFDARTTELMEVRTQIDSDLASLQPDIDKLKVSFAKVAPVLKSREVEVTELKDVLTRLHKEEKLLREEVKAMKEDIAHTNEKLANEKFNASKTVQEREALRNQIVRSPEKLRGRLAQMGSDVEAKSREVEEATNKLSGMQAQGLILRKVSSKLAKRVITMKACEEDKKKGKELHQEFKHKTQESQREEESLRELRDIALHLEKQISVTQDKLISLQKQGEEKRAKAQQALDETERKKMLLQYSINQDKEQVKINQGIVQRKELELQRLTEEHTREMDCLKLHYQEFANSLRSYHAELSQTTIF